MLNKKIKNIKHKSIDEHVANISKEFKDGLEFIKKYPKSVTIFGSSRIKSTDFHYLEAEKLSEKIVKELGYSVVTGGGPGIMESANKGANEAGGTSVGINIILPERQQANIYVDKNHSMDFYYFFVRKTILTFSAETYIFFPGGFGTLDEFFEIITLIQTKKIEPVPIVLFGSDFWSPFKNFMISHMVGQHNTIDSNDLDLFIITDSIDETIEIIKNAPIAL